MNTPHFNLRSLRWLVLLIFLFGLFDWTSPLLETDALFFWLTALSMLACGVLLSQLDAPVRRTLWVWAILGVFLAGHYWKTYLIGRNLSSPTFVHDFTPEWAWLSPRILTQGMPWITLAFVLFCVLSALILAVERRVLPSDDRMETAPALSPHALNQIVALLLGSSLLSLILAFLQAVLGIGVMNSAYHGDLPPLLNTLIYRVRDDVLPVLLLLCVYLLDRPEQARWWGIAATCLTLHWLLTSVLTTSRAAAVNCGLPLLFLWLLSQRLTRRRTYFIGALFLSLIVCYPFFSYLRGQRVSSENNLPEAIEGAFDQYFTNGLDFQWASNALVNRIIGADGIWFALADAPPTLSAERLYHFTFHQPITDYFTRDLVGVTDPEDWRSPGLIASFMLIGGAPAVLLFESVFILFAWLLWRLILRLRSAPVAGATLAYFLLRFMSEGTLRFQDLIITLICLGACEIVYRHVVGAAVPAGSIPRNVLFASK